MEKITPQLLSKIRKTYDMFYIAVSGGKDSTATLLWSLENLPEEKIYPFFIDIGNESKTTIDYIRYLEKTVKHRIIRILLNKDFSTLILEKGFFPSANIRYCTNILKIQPAQEILKAIKKENYIPEHIKNYNQIVEIKKQLPPNPKILTITGVRKEESLTRSKNPLFEKNNPLIQTDVLRPILNWKTEEVYKYIESKNIKINPLYEAGCQRVGCFPCIFANPTEIKLLFEKEEFEYDREKIKLLEEKIGRKFFIDKTLEEKYIYIKNKENKKQESLFSQTTKEPQKSYAEDICFVNGFSFCE